MKNEQKPFLSVIVPVYNEENRIGNLYRIENFLKKQNFNWEIITVDDGSADNTSHIIKTINKKIKMHYLRTPLNKGKGHAVKTGMLHAKGKYRLFLDIDLSTPIETFCEFLPYLKKFDVIIATRKTKGSKVLDKQSTIREAMGRTFTNLSRLITGVDISDFTCGFKCFSDNSTEEIFTRTISNRWAFDAEAMLLAKKYSCKIKEIPVVWTNDPRTKVVFPRDIILSLYELLLIRIKHI